MTISSPPSKFKRKPYVYLNKRVIKETNNSKIYLAFQCMKNDKKEVVIKYVPVRGKNKQIDLEIEIQNSLHNKYLMPLIDDFEIPKKYRVLIMEYGLGTLISGYDKTSHFFKSMQQLYKIMFQIAKGVDYLHTKKVLHGDIKPSNVLIMNDNNYMPFVQIIDFGYSVCLPEYDGTDDTCCKCHNLTPEYSAPEVLRSRPHSFPSDIWSLGATFYYVITQQYIFREKYRSCQELAEELEFGLDLPFNTPNGQIFPQTGKDMIYSMLNPVPNLRPTSKDIINSDFFKEVLDDQWLAEEAAFSKLEMQEETVDDIVKASTDKSDVM